MIVDDETEFVESELHKFLRPRGLRIDIEADTGVTPPEPDQYWTVWVTDYDGHGRGVAGSSDGNTSRLALLRLIEDTVDKWKQKYEVGESYE